MAKRDRGTGSVFQPKGSSVYWCQYYTNGKRVRENTHQTDKRKAINHLNSCLQGVAAGTYDPKNNKVMVDELVNDKLTTDRNNGAKSVDDMEADWRLHLKPFFGGKRASQVTTALLNKYIEHRKSSEIVKPYKLKTGEIRLHNTSKFPKNATINRELSLLRASMYMGYKATPPTVQRVPAFPMLEERNTRTGFLTDAQFTRLCDECSKIGLWLRTAMEIGATFGWRKDSEILKLRVRQIDLWNKVIRLEPDTTKNDDGREVTLTANLVTLLKVCVEGKKPDDHVFTWEDGRPVKDFRATWKKVCTAAGVPNLLFHDLRRTAARALRNAGVAEEVIMKIGGWRTANVFKRYSIVAQSDIRDAVRKLEQRRDEFSQSLAKEAQKQVQQQEQSRVVN